MKIAIILGSIREGRFGEGVAQWVLEQARSQGFEDIEFELIDIKTLDLPFADSAVPAVYANKHYDDERVARWGAIIDEADGYIFVTPEYNHSIPGAFKNAVDLIGREWEDKTIAFVGYAWDGAIRVVEQWRSFATQFNMYDVRAQLSISLAHEMVDNKFVPIERRTEEAAFMFNQLAAATRKLRG